MPTTTEPTSPEVVASASHRSPRGRWSVARNDRRLLAVIVVVGVLLRVAWAVYAARPPVGIQDPGLYTFYARQMANGAGYTIPSGEPTAYYPVGYPAALGTVFFIALHTPIPYDEVALTATFNIALAAISLVLVFEIARRVFDRRVALVATAIVAAFPNLVFHTAVPLTETLFNTLALAAVLVIVATDWSRRRLTTLVLFGALVGVSALVRPPSLLFIVALAVAGWWGSGWGWKETARSMAVAGVAALAVIAPWTYRNTVVMEKPVLISTNTGDNLCIGNNPESAGAFRLPKSCLDGFDHLERPEYETARDAHGQKEGVRYIVEEPLDQLRLVPLRLYNTFSKDIDALSAIESYGQDAFLDSGVRSVLHAVSNVFYFAVLLLGLLAAPKFFHGRSTSRLFLAVATLSLLLPPLVFFGDPRFKVPLMPFFAMAAAVTLVGIIDRVRHRTPTEPVPAS